MRGEMILSAAVCTAAGYGQSFSSLVMGFVDKNAETDFVGWRSLHSSLVIISVNQRQSATDSFAHQLLWASIEKQRVRKRYWNFMVKLLGWLV